MTKKNGFITIGKKEFYQEVQLIKDDLSILKSGFENHLEHHKTIERKNVWYIGIIVGMITLFVNIIFGLMKGG